jgi:hypothetical protein
MSRAVLRSARDVDVTGTPQQGEGTDRRDGRFVDFIPVCSFSKLS